MSEAAAATTERKIGASAIVSSVFLVATLVWALFTTFQIYSEQVRPYQPHELYDEVDPWAYDIDDWAGGRSFWFENLDYNDLNLTENLPKELLEAYNQVLFLVEPADPPQLWRSSSYDIYDQSGWEKSQDIQRDLGVNEILSRQDAEALGHNIYKVTVNVTAGPNTGFMELPTLFPRVQFISDSVEADPSDRLISYSLQTDDYGSLLLEPFVEGATGTNVLVSYEITYDQQDLANIAQESMNGEDANMPIYQNLGFTPSDRVIQEASHFADRGTAFDTAMAVDYYFETNYELMMTEQDLSTRPQDQEVTDWFIQRGGGLPMDFATAYCVFMRYLDIPARLVVGYAVGERINGGRAIKVFHMLFWSEVFIPLPGGGEWIQVIPYPLTNLIQTTENPENLGEGVVGLIVGTNLGRIWVNIGEEFEINALLTISGSPVRTPEEIEFWDDTDNVYIGSATIVDITPLPYATITYAFPSGSSIGFHNVSAIYIGDTYWAKNYTILYAVATPEPVKQSKSVLHSDFILSETIDVNLKQGLDDYKANWQDTVHVHGLLTAGGAPVDGDYLREQGYNDQMEIYWDNDWVDNATIQADGTYELDIFANPTDTKFIPGSHEVWSWYRGEWHPLGFWILAPARSADNSTITVYGTIEITLDVTPTAINRGGQLLYEGSAHFLNNTPLVNEDIGLFFGGTKFTDVTTNSLGDFSYTYTVPSQFPLGTTIAKANWTTTSNDVKGNWSNEIEIEVLLMASNLSIDSAPKQLDEVHMLQNIAIFGNLTDLTNGSGLVGQEVSIWWGNDTSAINLGNTTVLTPDGYYQLDAQVPTNYEGSVNYWAIFDSPYPGYLGARSGNLTITVNRLHVEISIQANPNPGHLLETITIEGIVTLPQISDVLVGAPIRVWWSNITGSFELGIDNTNSSGGYSITYQIPLSENFGLVTLWANYSFHENAYYSNESQHIQIQVTNYNTNLNLLSNSTNYYLNNTMHIYGLLQRDDNTPIPFQIIDFYITWHNGTVKHLQIPTNSSGYYNYIYQLSLEDGVGTVIFDANFTSSTILYNDSVLTTPVSVNLVLYSFTLSANLDNIAYHLDEVIQFSGTLTFDEGSIPVIGKPITIWYQNETGTFSFAKVTGSAGDFVFLYNLSINDALGAIWVWANFTSINPLHDNATSIPDSATIIQYVLDVSFTTDKGAYYLDEVVQIKGRLTHENGSGISGRTILIYWNNASGRYEFQNVTDSSGFFYYNYTLNPYTDSVGTVTIESNFTHFYKPWANATYTSSGKSLNRYSFNLNCFTNGTSFYLDQVVNITGYLEFSHNNSAFKDQWVTINWDNGSLTQYAKMTDVTGKFQFFYNLSVIKDLAGPADVWLEFIFIDPLWNNATSNARNLTLNRYSFTLTCLTNGTSFYLDQVVNITGQLKFSHNNTLLNYTQIRITWFNGSLNEFFASTDYKGYFEFLYNLSVPTDSTGTIDIQAWFNNTNPLWNNATSLPPTSIALNRYSFNLACITNGTTFYLDQIVNITGTLQFLNNGSPLVGEQVAIYWDNGTEHTYFRTTDSSGRFQFFYNLTGTKDSAGLVNVWLNFTNINPLWENVSSTMKGITLLQYQLQLDVTVPSTVYLDQSVVIQGNLTHSAGLYPVAGITINVYYYDSLVWTLVGTQITNSTGGFRHLFNFNVPPDIPGLYQFKCNTSTGPLYIDTTTSILTTNAQKHNVGILLLLSQNPVYLNESLTFYVYLYYEYNISGAPGIQISLYWDNGTEYHVYTAMTNASGWANYTYSSMSEDRIWTGITVYANFSQSNFILSNESQHQPLTLRQWDTIILNFDTGGVSLGHPGESVSITGNLYYTSLAGPDVEFRSATIRILINGTFLDTTLTGVGGAFFYSWDVPTVATPGLYLISVQYNSTVNWIENYTSSSISFTIGNYILVWNVNVSPSTVYRSEYLRIAVNVSLDNGSAYAGTSINIYWDHLGDTSGPILIGQGITDANGIYIYYHRIDDSEVLGVTSLWANCTPIESNIDPGQSALSLIQIEQIPVNLEASVDANFVYVGDSIVFSGTLTFGNLTPMEGYFVRIVWEAVIQNYSWNLTIITEPSGSFQHTFDIPWNHPAGISAFYVIFVKASDAFVDNQTSIQSVEIWDQVNIILDDQSITVVKRRDTINVIGYVINQGFYNVSFVRVALLSNGNETGLEGTTDGFGRFSIPLNIPNNAMPGIYIITLNISSNYYELIQSDYWNITIMLESYLFVNKIDPLDINNQWTDIMPGESFNISVRLQNQAGTYLNNTNVNVYLNDTLLQTSYLRTVSFNMIQVVIPTNWATSGYYYINITYSGSTFTLPTWLQINDDLHIFTKVYVNITGDTVVAQRASILIRGVLVDDQNNPIVNREVSLVYNGTPYFNVTTDRNGIFGYSNIDPTNVTGDYEYTIIFYSKTGNQILGPFTITVRALSGPTADPLVILLWIGVIAVEMVIALVLITRKRFSYTRISRQFHPQIQVGAKNNQQLMLRWL